MTVQRRAWLWSLCALDSVHLCRPFRVTLNGIEYDCATNGRALLLMRAPCAFEPHPDAVDAETVQKVLQHTATAELRGVSFAALRDWAFDPTLCAACGGARWVQGTGECCCDGFRRQSPGRILGRLVDRRLLWRFISPLQTDTVNVYVGGPLEAVHVVASHWTLVLMPMREDEDDGDRPELRDWIRATAEVAAE